MANGWGGARPGAGRKRRNGSNGHHHSNGLSSAPPGVTLGQALQSLRSAAPQPPTTVGGAPVGAQLTGAAAPPAGVTPSVRPDNQSFAKLVGYVGTNVGILVIRDALKRGGMQAQEPDAEDVDRTTDATADAIARALGDAEIPWWGTLVAAWGSLYLSMRLGARPLPTEDTEPAAATSAAATTTTTTAPAPPTPTTPLGRGVPQPPKRAGAAYTRLPEVGIVST